MIPLIWFALILALNSKWNADRGCPTSALLWIKKKKTKKHIPICYRCGHLPPPPISQSRKLASDTMKG